MPYMGDKALRSKTGHLGERIAAEFLNRKGFRVVAMNYRRPCGEVDIVAEKAGQVRFVEVKTVTREAFGGISREMDYRPEELVHDRKL